MRWHFILPVGQASVISVLGSQNCHIDYNANANCWIVSLCNYTDPGWNISMWIGREKLGEGVLKGMVITGLSGHCLKNQRWFDLREHFSSTTCHKWLACGRLIAKLSNSALSRSFPGAGGNLEVSSSDTFLIDRQQEQELLYVTMHCSIFCTSLLRHVLIFF